MKKIIILSLLLSAVFTANIASAFPVIIITTTVGGPGEDCPGSSICSIKIGLGLAVAGSAGLDNLTGALNLKLSASDLQQYQPEKLQYFNSLTHTVTFTTSWIAPQDITMALEAKGPVVIPAGIYPYTLDLNNNFVIVIPQPGN